MRIKLMPKDTKSSSSEDKNTEVKADFEKHTKTFLTSMVEVGCKILKNAIDGYTSGEKK
jgi:ribosomal protein S17E